jgi:hypothetical protein
MTDGRLIEYEGQQGEAFRRDVTYPVAARQAAMNDQSRSQRCAAASGKTRWVRAVAAAALAVTLTLLAAAPTRPVQAQSPPTTVTFEYTGAAQSWTVPAGVTPAIFHVFGASVTSDSFFGGAR